MSFSFSAQCRSNIKKKHVCAKRSIFLALAKHTWGLLVFFFPPRLTQQISFCARGNTKSLLTYLLGSHSVRPLWLNFPWRFRCSLNDFIESLTSNSDWLKRVVPCLNGDFPLVTSGWKDSLSSFAWICFRIFASVFIKQSFTARSL